MREWMNEERYRVLESADDLRPLHDRAARSPYRQRIHIVSVSGLLNDPNAFYFKDGVWHLFYQWCPWGAVHGLKYWYHVVSSDLATWQNAGVAICPDSDFDNKGAYSGSALLKDSRVLLYYSGNHRDSDWTRRPYTCVAELTEDGSIKKLPPLFSMHADYSEHQRDPQIIYDDERDCYYILLGAQRKDQTGCVIVYRSDCAAEGWRFFGELKVPGYEDFGEMWECPSLRRISGHDVLFFCPQKLTLQGRRGAVDHCGCLIGQMDWESLTFTPNHGGFHVLDDGFDFYAADCASNPCDPDKVMMIAWMGLPDASYPTDDEDWSGCLTLPCELTIEGGCLIRRPVPALKKLRGESCDLHPDDPIPQCCEIGVSCTGGDLTLRLFTKADGLGGLTISYDSSAREITLDRSGLALRFNTEQGERHSRTLKSSLTGLSIFIDRSSVEVFVNDGEAVFSSRVFPTAGEDRFTIEGTAEIRLWQLNRAVEDNLVISF